MRMEIELPGFYVLDFQLERATAENDGIFADVKNLRLLYPRRAWNTYYIMKCGDNSWLFVGAPFCWLGFGLKCSLKNSGEFDMLC